MSKSTRAEFEAELHELGYGPMAPFEYDDCPHLDGERWAVYFMPDVGIAPDDPPPVTYGDLGWQLYESCESCAMEVVEGIWHGGMYEHLRYFGGETDKTDLDTFFVKEIPRAVEPLPKHSITSDDSAS